MYQRSGQLKPKTLNLDPLRRKTNTTETALGAAAMQARKQTNKQANKLHVRRCEGGGTKTWTKTRGDQNRDQNKGGNNRGLFEQGES